MNDIKAIISGRESEFKDIQKNSNNFISSIKEDINKKFLPKLDIIYKNILQEFQKFCKNKTSPFFDQINNKVSNIWQVIKSMNNTAEKYQNKEISKGKYLREIGDSQDKMQELIKDHQQALGHGDVSVKITIDQQLFYKIIAQELKIQVKVGDKLVVNNDNLNQGLNDLERELRKQIEEAKEKMKLIHEENEVDKAKLKREHQKKIAQIQQEFQEQRKFGAKNMQQKEKQLKQAMSKQREILSNELIALKKVNQHKYSIDVFPQGKSNWRMCIIQTVQIQLIQQKVKHKSN